MESSGEVCYQGDVKCPADVNTPMAWTTFKPRGSLARVLYEKTQYDAYLNQIDKNTWYECDLDKLEDANLASKFVQLHPDADTLKFLQRAEEKSDWIPTQIWHSIVKTLLSWFMTQTSINGWLERGSMFVVSQQQFLKLLKVKDECCESSGGGGWHKSSLLDLGAGDGEVTAHIAPLFDKVYVTELSSTMRKLLQRRNYQLLDIDNWYKDKKYDLISCLNLIDRCDKPLQLLKDIKQALTSDGLVLLAVVLPFSPYVESNYNHKPKESLPIFGNTFEEQVKTIVDKVLIPLNFEVVSWSRVPYLCEGDLQQSYYWLDDVIFVLKVR